MRSFSEAAADGNCEHLRPAGLCPDSGHRMQSRTWEGGVGRADKWLRGLWGKQQFDSIASH